MNRSPLVSLGLPVYNGEDYIGSTLDSILAQTYTNFEVVISDNASTDRTQEICIEYATNDLRIKYFRNDENLGASRNFNRTFKLSSGKYFKWCGHDDLLAPEYLERCIQVLENNERAVICFPKITYIDSKGHPIGTQKEETLSIVSDNFPDRLRTLFDFQIRGDDSIAAIFALMRRSALLKTALWGLFVSSEEILIMEVLSQGVFVQITEALFFFRDHSQRAFVKNVTPSDRLAWFDPKAKKIFQLPVWLLLTKYLGWIRRAPLSFNTRLRCYFEVARRSIFLWRRFAGDIIKLIAQFFGIAVK